MEALVGKILKGYEIRALIGHGGFGSVYRAYQASIEREVAIKAILPAYANKPEFIRQFEAEARVVARLEHPFIAPLFDFWREPDAAYLVMRYFAAGSLAKFLDTHKGGLPLKRAVQILEQVASALDTAHQANMIHLDIKPDNILLDNQGNAYLADFGLARSLNEQKDNSDHATGSLAYMSPEMLRGERLSPQSDIYSLSLVFYEMLVGHHPFVDADTKPLSINDLMMAQLMDYLPTIPHLSEGINAVLQRASAKDPLDRYPSASLFTQAVREVLAAESLLSPSEIEELSDTVAISNPYKGLEAFGESDAQNFFGRDTLVDELLARMQAHPFLALVGPSGSGKSSVVYAGLLPKLRQGALDGSADWFMLSMKPDTQPMQQLESALRSIAISNSENLGERLQKDGLEASLDSILPNRPTLLLLIDQFEEVFTQSEDQERKAFLDLLHTSTTKPESRIHVLLTLRADFYDRPLLYETFGKLIQAHTQVILPLSSEEIRAAIVRPTERLGLQVEAALVTAILADVSSEVGALPLLQYALTEVFQRRNGRKLSLEAYTASGGVLGALARRADELYLELSPEAQTIAKQIFLRLVTLGEGTEDTRRRVRQSELNSLGQNKAELQAVTDVYGKYRLLSFDRDTESREATLEIAHEALIREWGRLQTWLNENRQDIRLQRLLASSANDWHNSGSDASYLLRGSRLAQYAEWSSTTQVILSSDEAKFLQASLEERLAQDAQAAARKAHEEQLQRRSQRFLQAIVVILVLASIAGTILTGFIYQQSQIAASERDSANSLSISLRAQDAFLGGDNLLGLSLAMQAVSIPNPPQESYQMLLDLAYAPNLRQVYQPMNQAISAMALSPDGTRLLLGAGNSPLPRPGADRPPQNPAQGGGQNPPPQGQGAPQQSPSAQSPEGEPRFPPWLANPPADEAPFANNPLIYFDLSTGETTRSFDGHHASITAVQFIDANRAVSASNDGMVLVWDLSTGAIIYQYSLSPSRNISLSVAGNLLLVTLNGNRQTLGNHILYDLSTGEELRRIEPKTTALWAGYLFPDGLHGLSQHWDGVYIVWDTTTGEEVQRFDGVFELQRHESVQAVISADGTKVALNGFGETLQIWDWQADTIESIDSPSERPHRLALTPDGQDLIWITQSGVIDIWDIATEELSTRLGSFSVSNNNWAYHLFVTASGQQAVLGFESGAVELWDLQKSPENRVTEFTEYPLIHNATYLSDTQILLYGAYWRANTGLPPRVIEPHLAVWDIPSKQISQELSLDTAFPAALTTRDGFALAGSDATVRGVAAGDENRLSEIFYFNLATGEQLWQQDYDPELRGTGLAINPANPEQVLTVWGNEIRLWDTTTGEILHTYEGHTGETRQVTFNPDGNQFLSSAADNHVLLWDTASGAILQDFTVGRLSEFLLFTPDGSKALSSSANSMTLWDLETGAVLETFIGHESFVRDAVLSADATRLWSASEDGEVIAWDVATGQELYRYTVPAAQFWDIDISPDGQNILTATSDKLIIWRTNPLTLDEVLAWIRANRFIRTLTESECRRYHIEACDLP